MNIDNAINLMLTELSFAKKKHPGHPESIIKQMSIMVEEAGEAVTVANDIDFFASTDSEKTDLKKRLQKELSQTGAMAIRSLISYDFSGGDKQFLKIEDVVKLIKEKYVMYYETCTIFPTTPVEMLSLLIADVFYAVTLANDISFFDEEEIEVTEQIEKQLIRVCTTIIKILTSYDFEEKVL